ncbi:hypothetical protein SDC9_93932 [bioreactor metagenome]|uniref:Uncharacterized protein n=1 Tax=bioreactor metagenome TaxID=1076179 RepID=A0A645AC07_9ZZZZ
MKLLDVADNLLQTRGNGKAAVVGHIAEEHIEITDLVFISGLKVAVAHRELVKIAKEGVVAGAHKFSVLSGKVEGEAEGVC